MAVRLAPRVALAAIVSAPAVVGQSVLHEPRAVEDLLPASTYAAVRFGGLDACAAAAARLPLGELARTFFDKLPAELRDEAFAEGLDEASDELRLQLQDAGIKPADLRVVLSRPMVLSMGRVSIEGMGPSVCLLLDGSGGKDEINRTMQALARLLPRLGADYQMDRAEVAGHRLYRLQTEEGPPVFAGWLGEHYCVSNSRPYLAEVVAVMAGNAESLSAASDVGVLRQQLPNAPLLSGTVHLGTLFDAVAPLMPYEAEAFADALGVGRVDVVYGAVTAGDEGGSELLHVGVGGSEHGLMKALVAEPADLGFASACSPNTVLFGAGSFDVGGVVEAFHKFVELLPAEAQREIRREMGREFDRELRQMGTSPQEVHAMLRAFGNQVGMAVSLEKGAVPKPELLMRISVRDAGVVQSLMQRIEAMTTQEGGVEWRSREANGSEIRFCNVPIEDQFMVSPCYWLDEHALWIGSDVRGLAKAVKRADEPEESLAAEEDFRTLQQRTDGASGVLYLRTFRGIEIGWRSIETMLYPMLDAHADEVGFDSSALPDGEQLAEALGSSTLVYRVDDDGVTVRSHGPFGMGSLVAGLGGVFDYALSRATAKVY